ncbi:hypothetical protein EJ357_35340 [Streptomyces cyaneochromogenes]|uniref:Uncharacterized protein n=1 Tax=Streptomyces cyaneochromogenes TaxID=2496836 RepID=A0A3Q9EXM7_9ACTN|nr:hypothetical protein [Streptomyces cyaneochromogenes]AZQ38083.1 hypothetical protein EJ357_35340 [Streptomyces cyaneochromogenes]
MSCRKRIQVDQSEWYRLQQRARQLREVKRDIPRLFADVRARTQADIDRAFNSVTERQRRQQEAVDKLSDQTRRLEAETTSRLREQADSLRKELRETAGRIEQDTRRRLEDQRKETERAIAVERERIDGVVRARERAEITARTWLSDARIMADLIDGELPHERYAPGRLDSLRGRIATAEQNTADGHYDAALAGAQETFHGLSDLRVDIEQREFERCLAQKEAIEALVQVETLAEENRERPVVGPDDEVVAGYVLDVAHWSEGEFDLVLRDTDRALARARDPRTGVEDLRGLRDDEAPRLEQSLGETVERAGMRQLTSQMRLNLADIVADRLAEIGFYDLMEKESGYIDGDFRKAFRARLRNEATGNEITVEIEQADKDSDQCVIRVVSHDYDVTSEAELQDRGVAVYEVVQEQGAPMGLVAAAPVTEVHPPDPGTGERPGSSGPGTPGT